MKTLRIDAERLLRSLEEMGEIGRRPGGAGRTRLALDDGDRAGRDRFAAWLRDAKLDVVIDQKNSIHHTF